MVPAPDIIKFKDFIWSKRNGVLLVVVFGNKGASVDLAAGE